MKRLAIINQRYGLEVNGGSEYYTRLIAEHLKEGYDVQVLTTCAVDYVTWANYYSEGEEDINGVCVKRFPVERERNTSEFNRFTEQILDEAKRTPSLEQRWIEEQGPFCPALIKYLIANKQNYDVFIFVTYLYYLTAVGLPEVAEKSILIPTAHDEPFLKFTIYRKVFEAPRGYIFLTSEEEELVRMKFQINSIRSIQAAVGIEVPNDIKADRFKKKYQIDAPFMIYVGRIDEGKNCHWMFRYFKEYKKRNPRSRLKLVLMGKAVIPVHSDESIISLGFVSEQDKYDGIAASEFLILPSELESLSISVLEAMGLEKPILVNGKCAVLKGHCVKSNGGLYYNNYFEFEAAVNYMGEHSETKRLMGENAHKYVEENYRWNVILRNLGDMIDSVSNEEAL